MAEGAKDVLAINKAIADLGTEVGIVEQQKLKLYRTITNAPFIKQTIQLSNFLKRIQGVQQANQDATEAEEDANEQRRQSAPLLTTIVATMTSYGVAAKVANKGTTAFTANLFRLASMGLFIFGIVMTMILGLAALTVAFADVNSPLMDLMNNIPGLGPIMDGLRLIISGEEGEGGMVNALNILAVAMAAGGAALLLFGAPVAIIVATLVAAVGVFKWVKNSTDSFVAGVMGAAAVITAGLAVFAAYCRIRWDNHFCHWFIPCTHFKRVCTVRGWYHTDVVVAHG